MLANYRNLLLILLAIFPISLLIGIFNLPISGHYVIEKAPAKTSLHQLPSPTPTKSYEQRIDDLEESYSALSEKIDSPRKDIWDIINSLSGLISGIVIVIISIIASRVYRERKLAISKAQTIEKFLPHLFSDNEKFVEIALLAIAELGSVDIASNIAEKYKEGAISALNRLSGSVDRDIAKEAKNSLQSISDDAKNRVRALVEYFNEQTVPGELFGLKNEIQLPIFESIESGDLDSSEWYSIQAQSNTETWYIVIKLPITSWWKAIKETKDSFILQANPQSTLWFIVMGEIPETERTNLQQNNFLVSSISDIVVLEEKLNVSSIDEQIDNISPLIF